MTDIPILYSFRRCPYAMRARLAIMSAQVTCELREIMLRNKPAHMVEISPKATVPVLQMADGIVLEESLDIALWALSTDDPEHLLSSATHTKQDMLELIERTDLEFKPLLDLYKYRFHAEPEMAKSVRDDAAKFLQLLDEQLNDAFLFGDRISLADICILPFVRQFASVDKEWFWAQDIKNTIQWLDNFLESERFSLIMPKYPLWTPGNEKIYFPRKSN